MGTWSTAIDGNDTFLDIYSNFYGFYNQGYNPAVASKQILRDFSEMFDDPDERNNALFALALVQWETKSQDAEVYREVRGIIESNKDIKLWKELDATAEQLRDRQNTLDDFLLKVTTPKKNAKRRVKVKFEFQSVDLVNVTAPDNLKKFIISEQYTNNVYIQTGSIMQWHDGGGSVLYFKGQAQSISATWIDSQTLEITHDNDIAFLKKDSSAYYCGDEVKIVYRPQ